MQKKKKEYTSLTVRFPPWLYDAIRTMAKDQGRSINGQVIWMLQQGAINHGRPMMIHGDGSTGFLFLSQEDDKENSDDTV